MLRSIFLFKGNTFQDVNHLDLYYYPQEVITVKDKEILKKIVSSHQEKYYQEKESNSAKLKILEKNKKIKNFDINKPIYHNFNGLNLYTISVNQNIFIGLTLDKEDNPYDYKEIFQEILDNNINSENDFNFDGETEIETLLISLFIDLRRYEDEIINKFPEIEFNHHTNSFTKVFLFGIDNVGKTSYIRRLKTGKYSDNYFMPTRRFNIEYIKKQDEEKENLSLSVWDMPGQRIFRKKWLIGLQDSNVIIYMIDVANQSRFKEAKNEFWKIINRFELQGTALLILGNKIDLLNNSGDHTLDEEQLDRLKNEIYDIFEFQKIKKRKWKFILTSVKTNYNIEKSINLISEVISK